jgi:aminoglycoside phosphotransferase (APT) family kinase protein
MDSITKNRQSPEALRAMVARAYGAREVPLEGDWFDELGDGWFNVVYRIRLRSGARVVLKIAPPPGVEVMTYERDVMATELRAMELIREHTDVPVPTIDLADRSRQLCDADYFFMSYVDADNLAALEETLSRAELDACHRAVGAATRELNRIRGAAFGPLTGPGDDSWRVAFTRMIGDVLRDGERRAVDLGHGYDRVRAVVAEHQHCLDEVTEPRFVAWDLWDSNVLVRDGRIVALVDHERAFYGDPLMEAGFTAVEMSAFGDPSAFLEGYGRAPSTAGERCRRRLYCLYLVLIMVIETVYRGHTDPAGYRWARERMDEVMALFGRSARAG